MTLGTDWEIDALLTFAVNTHDPTTAGAPEADADAVPGYRVYEDETGTPILTGSMAKLDDANTLGYYSEQITLSAANGFEVGKCYSIRIRAVVTSIAQSVVYHFRMAPSFAEPGQDTPAATTTLAKKVGYLYKHWRNRKTSDSTTIKLYNDDATTVGQKVTRSDASGTYDHGEVTTGP